MNLINSINDFNDAKSVIPGGVNSPIRAFNSVGGNPRIIKEANSCFLIDEDNNTYIDFVQSFGPLIFGHQDKDIINAINYALKKGTSYGAPTNIETKLAKEIISIYEGIDKIRLVSSGTEATMSAIRLARGFTNRDDIIKFEGCYHGHSDCLLVNAGSGCVGIPASCGVPKDFTNHTLVAKYNDIDSVISCFKQSKNIACVIIEPIAGNMGLVPSEIDFLKKLRELCDENGALLILDEVMSGFRAAINGSLHYYHVNPDLATFGKVIGGGLPLGAFGGRGDIMDMLAPIGNVYQAGTLSGNPIASSAGYEALLKIKSNPNLYSNLENLALRLTDGMKERAKSHKINLQVCVRGSMFGFFFSENEVKNFDDARKNNTKLFANFYNKMLERGVYFAPSSFESNFICTPMDSNLIDKVIEDCEVVFSEIENGK